MVPYGACIVATVERVGDARAREFKPRCEKRRYPSRVYVGGLGAPDTRTVVPNGLLDRVESCRYERDVCAAADVRGEQR